MILIKYLLLNYFKSGADILVLLLWLNVMTFVLVESAKSSACVLGVLCALTRLVCFCAYVPVCLACCRAKVLVCLASGVLTCPRLGVLACLRAHVFGMFACFMSFVVTCLTCFDIVCPIFFTFEKLTPKNPYTKKIYFDS